MTKEEEKHTTLDVEYHGCHDCEYQPEPLMACEWLHKQTTIFISCPRWQKRRTSDDSNTSMSWTYTI